jgi:hypothetical protein
VIEAATGLEVRNVFPASLGRVWGDVVFQAERPGRYELYYLPYTLSGEWYLPIVTYTPAGPADPAWLERTGLAGRLDPDRLNALPQAEAATIESRTPFDRFDPMEVIAAPEEVAGLAAAHPGRAWLTFPEDRRHPIRMHDALPLRWIERGPSDAFAGQAQPNEYYAFQVGVWALQPLADLRAEIGDLRAEDGRIIPAAAMTCFNLGGVDWLGQPFAKRVPVPAGEVQALWFGVDVPADAQGIYRGDVTLRAENAEPRAIAVTLEVGGPALADRGDGELWRLSRLRWLDSPRGLDDLPTEGYPALRVDERAVFCLGRRVRFGSLGLPDSIASFFAPTVDRLQDEPIELLARPVDFVATLGGERVQWRGDGPALEFASAGAAAWRARSGGGPLALDCQTRMEFDGSLDFRLTLSASQDVALSGVALEIPLRPEAATHMMGLGCKGGRRPERWDYRWDVERANHMVWLGSVNAGLQCKLKHDADVWELYNLKTAGLPPAWDNGGRGGCSIAEEGGAVVLRAFTGPFQLRAGQAIAFRFSLLITPLKLIDTVAHWQQRYYHVGGLPDAEEAARAGATIINVHQGNALVPHINYPFRHNRELGAFIDGAHARGLKVKLYYTVRELSNYAEELWALRSLGGEVLVNGPGFVPADHFAERKSDTHTGGPWLCEHLVDRYAPAWQQPFPDGQMDAAVATVGLSRWHNYYLEGLAWLIRNLGADGLYLDGIGYDRQVMKRVRKVMDRERPGCLIDFHSGNNFDPRYGLNNCANQYLEHFPFIDSLWFGEGFDYDESPDYWLVEISGFPFGLMGEMLQGGGNPWRGMLYGMTCRLGWVPGSDPRHVWALWESFGMRDSRMIGYWAPDCPARAGRDDVLATVYAKPGRALIALASWAPEPAECRLAIDWRALGLDPSAARLRAPAIPDFQAARDFAPGEPIPVAPGRGWLLEAS